MDVCSDTCGHVHACVYVPRCLYTAEPPRQLAEQGTGCRFVKWDQRTERQKAWITSRLNISAPMWQTFISTKRRSAGFHMWMLSSVPEEEWEHFLMDRTMEHVQNNTDLCKKVVKEEKVTSWTSYQQKWWTADKKWSLSKRLHNELTLSRSGCCSYWMQRL